MKKNIMILSNHHTYTYNFRKEIIQALLDERYRVTVVQPYGNMVEKLKEMGCKTIDLPLDRRGLNPINDFKLFWNYYKIIKKEKPDVVLSYTIKPNTYGGMACRLLKIPFMPNITGLGTALENKSLLQTIMIQMYKVSFKKASCVFFQNKENKDFFTERNIAPVKHILLPGSGVNLKDFPLLPYPNENNGINFLFISRIMKEKGIDQYIEAATYIKKKNDNTHFHVLGFCEDDKYKKKLKDLEQKNIITYHGMQKDIKQFQEMSHCTIHPTYYPEGMSNVLLESAASGRPIITTNRSGCKEIVEHEKTGYIIDVKDTESLIRKIEKFLSLEYTEKKLMGVQGRKKIVTQFDRNIVVEHYLKEIKELGEKDGL